MASPARRTDGVADESGLTELLRAVRADASG